MITIMVLVTLCIYNIAVLGILVLLYVKVFKKTSYDPADKTTSAPALKQDEEELKEARKRYLETEKAFEDMMNYNAYKAYGMEPKNPD